MKITKKIIVYILVLCFICTNIFSSYIFAENNQYQCWACSGTPDGMQMYINFQVELLWILQWSENQKKNYWWAKRSWLFWWWYFAVPEAFVNSIKTKVKKNIDRELESARSLMISTVILYKLTLSHALSDWILSISILFRNESFVRDYKILQEIDMSTNDIIRDMAELWIRDKKITPDTFLQIQNLQMTYTQEYGWRYPIFEKFIVSDNVKNKQLLTFIYRLNSLMKWFLYNVEHKYFLRLNASVLENLLYDDGKIEIKFNEKFIDYVASGYECAVWWCNYWTKRAARELAKDIAETGRKTWKAFWRSKDLIVNSTKELWAVLKNMPRTQAKTLAWTGNNWWLTDKQIQLLRTIYGADTKNLTTTQIQSFKLLRSKTKEEFQPIWDLVSTVSSWAKLVRNGLTKKPVFPMVQEEISSTSSNQVIRNNKSLQSESRNSITESMKGVIAQVLALKTQDKQIALWATNQDVVSFFQMWEYIHKVIIDGDIKWADWLVQSLWMLCEYQCSNKWNKNCFAE